MCLLGIPTELQITKMVTEGTTMELQGLQNTSCPCKSHPFQQLTKEEFPAYRGAAGAKLLNEYLDTT